ncbi:MAG: DUF1848 domain-containing protein [Lachnospiraceae bacterium]|nr:DUF1848 domain-containing protein [Lachnospiraceae bacterium]
MILSVSRRTDIPSYYSEWFFNRIKAGFACVRNPMNPRQVSRVGLSPEAVECIVFWTKNPEPMLERLEELSAYHYYFQFTLTGYGRDVESNLPPKKERLIPVFQRLADMVGSRRVIWRYDPIIFTKIYTPAYHLKAFGQIAEALNGCTERCVISFVDTYAKNRKELQAMGALEIGEAGLTGFCRELAKAAEKNGMTVGSCAEEIDLSHCGIEHNCCIDKQLIEEITGRKLSVGKDKNQRAECGCTASVDIGAYNTCRNGCRYCYANYSSESVRRNCGSYDPESPILCGRLTEEDRVSERKTR